MKKIFSHDVLPIVENLHNVLKLNGIKSTIRSENLNVGIGGMGCCPELWVSDQEFEHALKLIETIDTLPPETDETWVCSNCMEEVEGQFSECWNCGKPRRHIL